MSTSYDTSFLNSFFTSNEFDFIEHMDSDIESSIALLEKEKKDRDIIVSLVNNLDDSIYFHRVNKEFCDDEQQILQAAKNAFELINYNISVLHSNNELSNSIKKDIVDLLIRIDADGENVSESKYIDEISNLRNKISEITEKLKSTKAKIDFNDNTINEFLNANSVKECIKRFEIEYDDESSSESQVQPETESETASSDDNEVSESPEATYSYSDDIVENNNVLLISEKRKKVYLPYSKDEVLAYLKQYPNQYKSFSDVIRKEFIFSSDLYLKHPVIARFREAYSLIRDREAKSVLDAFKYAMEIMFKYDLNPVIIAACKSQNQLDHYLKCLASKNLDKFTDFEIKFEVSPLKV